MTIASRCCRSLAVALVALASVARAEAESELTLTLRNEQEGGSRAARPWLVAAREPEHASRARFALQLADPGRWPALSTFALLRLEAPLDNVGSGEPITVRDASSSIALALRASSRFRLEARGFPFDTDYLRLGYLHALDWGGTDVEAGQSVFMNQRGGVPGALLSLDLPHARLLLGAKWTTPAPGGARRLWGALLSAKLEPTPALRIDAGLGYFERPELAPGLGGSDLLEGGSVRLMWRRDVDEPDLPVEPFRRASFGQEALALAPPRGGEGWALAVEGSLLIQRHPALEAASSRLVPAPAGALYGSLRHGAFQAHAVVLWRSLRFVLRNERTVLQAPSPDALEHAELRAWLGGSAALGQVPLTPGLELGLTMPAALEAWSGRASLRQSFVVDGVRVAPLPPGEARLPALAARVSLRFSASRSVALCLLADYTWNPNATRLAESGERELLAPGSLGIEAGAQARF